MEELETTAKGVMIRLKCDDVDLLLSALNEALETVEDWEFWTRTGFEKSESRGLQEALQVVRSKMSDERCRCECSVGVRWRRSPVWAASPPDAYQNPAVSERR